MSRSMAHTALLMVVVALLTARTTADAFCQNLLPVADGSQIGADILVKGSYWWNQGLNQKVLFNGKMTSGTKGNITGTVPVTFPTVNGMGCAINDTIITTGKPKVNLTSLNTALLGTKVGSNSTDATYILSLSDATGVYEKGTRNVATSDYTKLSYTMSGLKFNFFTGKSAAAGQIAVPIKVGTKKTLTAYAVVTEGTVDVDVTFYRKAFMTGGSPVGTTIQVDPTSVSIKSLKGCSLQLRKKVTPPDFYLDCSKVKVTLNVINDDGSDPSMEWSAAVVLNGAGVTAKALVSELTQEV